MRWRKSPRSRPGGLQDQARPDGIPLCPALWSLNRRTRLRDRHRQQPPASVVYNSGGWKTPQGESHGNTDPGPCGYRIVFFDEPMEGMTCSTLVGMVDPDWPMASRESRRRRSSLEPNSPLGIDRSVSRGIRAEMPASVAARTTSSSLEPFNKPTARNIGGMYPSGLCAESVPVTASVPGATASGVRVLLVPALMSGRYPVEKAVWPEDGTSDSKTRPAPDSWTVPMYPDPSEPVPGMNPLVPGEVQASGAVLPCLKPPGMTHRPRTVGVRIAALCPVVRVGHQGLQPEGPAPKGCWKAGICIALPKGSPWLP
jgi:hypothetical protein